MIEEITEGLELVDGHSYSIRNRIYNSPLGFYNSVRLDIAYCHHAGFKYYFRKRKWKHRTVWQALPKKPKPTLADKIKNFPCRIPRIKITIIKGVRK